MDRPPEGLTPQEADEWAGLHKANEDRIKALAARGVAVQAIDNAKTVVLVEELCRAFLPGALLAWERKYEELIAGLDSQVAKAVILDGRNGAPMVTDPPNCQARRHPGR